MTFLKPVDSYDFHIYYKNDQVKEGITLKNKILSEFKDEINNDLIILKVLWGPLIGPHHFDFFEVDIKDVNAFIKFFTWIQLNHGNLSVLVHPNSGDMLKDHTLFAAWIGEKQPLKEEILDGLFGYPEFGTPSRTEISAGFYKDLKNQNRMFRVLDVEPIDDWYDRNAAVAGKQ